MSAENSRPGLLTSILTNRCPHCRQGKLFVNHNPYDLRTTMRMPDHCPVCGAPYELQTGFYFGTGFVSYGVSVLLLGVAFVAWALTFGLSYKDDSIYWCLGVSSGILLILQPLLQRLARSIWIAMFVKYDANWRAASKHNTGLAK
jgi:uncharacterized protein (DUF983 family)